MRGAWPPKCCFVVKEIMQTEIAYVQALADIIKVSPVILQCSIVICKSTFSVCDPRQYFSVTLKANPLMSSNML